MEHDTSSEVNSTKKPVELTLISAENIFLPIPNKSQETQTAIDLTINVRNNQANNILVDYHQKLAPELSCVKNSLLQLHKLKKEQSASGTQKIKAKNEACWYLQGKLFWHEEQLEFELLDHPSFQFEEPMAIWKFVGLTAGVYKFRFTYSETNEQNEEKLTTQWVNLHLLEPLETNPRAINANGIIFETIPPQTVTEFPGQPIITFPYSGETDFQSGVRITNLTTLPMRFALRSFVPNFFGKDIGFSSIGVNRNVLIPCNEKDIPVVQSNETVEFLTTMTLSSKGAGGREGYGGFWSLYKSIGEPSYEFKPGTYYLRFSYKIIKTNGEILLAKNRQYTNVDGFWTGSITTPFVKLVIH